MTRNLKKQSLYYLLADAFRKKQKEIERTVTNDVSDFVNIIGEEIGRLLGIEPDAVRKRLSRARMRLAELMERGCIHE